MGRSAVSIHVPAKGTTLFPTVFACQNLCFNPRSREGNDVWCFQIFFFPEVSIHVPAKGTTMRSWRTRSEKKGFNPRSREGNDIAAAMLPRHDQSFNPRSREGNDFRVRVVAVLPEVFQSTFPRRERPRATCKQSWIACFNPRSREGNDHRRQLTASAGSLFQSTFPRRERPSAPSTSIVVNSGFNPRSREGNDASSSTHDARIRGCFNPRSREGNDLYPRGPGTLYTPVSIHVPAKGTTKIL